MLAVTDLHTLNGKATIIQSEPFRVSKLGCQRLDLCLGPEPGSAREACEPAIRWKQRGRSCSLDSSLSEGS